MLSLLASEQLFHACSKVFTQSVIGKLNKVEDGICVSVFPACLCLLKPWKRHELPVLPAPLDECVTDRTWKCDRLYAHCLG